MRCSINLRFLLASLLGFSILAVATHCLHAVQLGRQSAFMLERTRQYKAEERFEPALRGYQVYLQMAPKDVEARAEFGLLLAQRGLSRMAAAILETALRNAPDRNEWRRRLVDLYIALRRHGDAQEHLRLLMAAFPADSKLWQQLGICQEAGSDDAAAVESFRKAIELNPAQCESYVRLADVLRLRLDRGKEADGWMDKLVDRNAASTTAHLLRARYLHLRTKHRDPAALSEAEKSVQLDPKNVDALLLAADLSALTDDPVKGRRYAERTIAASPALADGYLALFRIEIRGAHREKAIEALRRGIEKASRPALLTWNLGRILIEQGRLDEARKTVEQIRSLPANKICDPVLIDDLQAQIEAAQGHWRIAASAFEDVARQLERPEEHGDGGQLQPGMALELLKEVEYRLARCYEQLGNTEAQLAAYRKAAHIDPLWVPARLGVAATLSSLGQINDALEEYRQIGRLEGMAATADLEVARLQILKNLRLDATRRDWREAEVSLAHLGQAMPESTELPLLRAEVLFGQGRGLEAETLLAAARSKTPEKTEIWSASVALAGQQQQWDRAIALLAEADKKFGDRVVLRVARGRLLLTRYGTKASRDLVKLGENAARFSPEDRLLLDHELAICLWNAGDPQHAKDFAARACEADRANPAVRLLMFELAYASHDLSGVERSLAEIRSFLGEGALWHYGEAVRLAVEAERAPSAQEQASRFAQALQHLATARGQRPSWSRVPLLAARLHDRQGQLDAAIENYGKAIEAGETDPATVRRAFELLCHRQRYVEADEMLRCLEQRQAVFLTELGRMASAVSMRLENIDRAVEFGRKVADQSADWADHLWLGELQASLGRRALAEQRFEQARANFATAEKSLRRAVELGPAEPAPWVGLIRFLAASGQKSSAEALLGDALRKIPAARAALALGPCYEALGRLDEATQQYHAILAKGGRDPAILRCVAEFCLRANRPQEAEDCIQRILGGQVTVQPPDIAWARRGMAGILRQRGGYANLLQAQALLEQNLAGASTIDDLREKAAILAVFPQRARRLEAMQALEQVLRSRPAEMAEVRFMLANLYLRENDWIQTNKQMRALLANHGKEIRFLAAYVAMLMDRNEMQEAELWLKRLEEFAPEDLKTVLLRAESLVRGRQTDKAVQHLHQFLDRASAKAADRDATILQVVSSLKTLANGAAQRGDAAARTRLLAETETLVRDYATRHPGDAFRVALTLMQEGCIDEALNVAEKSWPEAPPGALAEQSQELIGCPALSAAQIVRLEQVLLSIREKSGRPIPLLLVVGELRMRQHPQDAVEIYREVLKKDPNNLVALNNLALVLALAKQSFEESLKLVDRALAIAGPMPAILDTRASVRMAAGQWKEALADLDQSNSDDPQPTQYFHRALTCWRLGQQKAAAEAFREARSMGLAPQRLFVLERADYDELARNLPR